MFGIFKKQRTVNPLSQKVWMIRHRETGLLLGVCKKHLVHIKDPKNCFRFSDIDAAGIFLYWLINVGQIKLGEYEAICSLIEEVKRG